MKVCRFSSNFLQKKKLFSLSHGQKWKTIRNWKKVPFYQFPSIRLGGVTMRHLVRLIKNVFENMLSLANFFRNLSPPLPYCMFFYGAPPPPPMSSIDFWPAAGKNCFWDIGENNAFSMLSYQWFWSQVYLPPPPKGSHPSLSPKKIRTPPTIYWNDFILNWSLCCFLQC